MTGKKIMKIIGIIIATIILLAGSGIFILVKTIDPNTIKNKITEVVHEKTGRKLEIAGDVSFTFFPWLGVKIEKISLDDSPNFSRAKFAKAKEIGVSVKLLPLIFGRIEAGNLVVKNLNLHLIKNRAGKNNWDNLLISKSKPSTTTKAGKNGSGFTKFTINNIIIDNGNILCHDQQANKKITISNLDLRCKDASLDDPFVIKTSFDISGFAPSLDAEVNARTKITLNIDKKLYELKKLNLKGTLKNKKNKRSSAFSIGTTLALDLKKDILLANDFKLNIASINATGNIKGTNITNQPGFSGDMSIKDSNLDETGKLFDVTPFKKIVDGTLLAKLSISPAITKINGNIKARGVYLDDLHLDNFTTEIAGHSKLIKCNKINFDFYDGKGTGNANIDLQKSTPRINVNMALKNTQMKPVLIDLAKYKKFSGVFTANTNISMHGKSADEILRSLNGNGNILVAKGSYQGVDVPYEVRRAHSILNMKPMPQKTSTPHTNFDKLTMSFNINRGIANTNDLLVDAPDYKVTGKGNINLVSKQLDLALSAYSKNDENFFVPIKITGPYNNPSIRPDAGVMIGQAVKGVLKDAIQKGVGKNLEKVIPEKLKDLLPF